MTKRRTGPTNKAASTAGKGRASKRGGTNNRKPKAVSKGAAAANHSQAAQTAPASRPLPKTTLTLEELEGFRRLLIQKRAELSGDVINMEREALKKTRSDASGDLSMMPIHMADIGTDNYEQEFTIGLIESEKEILKGIDAALERLKNGTYGICEATHKSISKSRLRAKPWARYSVEYKRSQEQNNRR